MNIRYPLAALAALVAGAGLFLLARPAPAPEAALAPSAVVSAIQPSLQAVPVVIDAAGIVTAGVAEMDVTLAAPGILTGVAVRPGQNVGAGQALAEIMPDAQSLAGLRKAQIAVIAAAAARDHVAALLAQHLATKADLAAALQALQDAEADLAAQRASGAGSRQRIAAPFAGTITAVPAISGSLLPAGATLLQLAPAGALSVTASLPEADALRVRPGDPATVTLLNTGTRLPAIVAQRAAMLDPQTGLLDVTLLPKGAVLLGEPVAIRIIAGSVTGYRVPSAAVLSDAQGDYVYLLDRRNIAHRETVQVLQEDGATSVLAPTLEPGLRLATTGAYQLYDGMVATLQGAVP